MPKVIAQIQRILPYKSLTFKTCHIDCNCASPAYRYRLPIAILYNKCIFKTVLFGLGVETLIGIPVEAYIVLDEVGLKSVTMLLNGLIGQIVNLDFRGTIKNGFVIERLSMVFSRCNALLMFTSLVSFYRDQQTNQDYEVSDSDIDSLAEGLILLQLPTQQHDNSNDSISNISNRSDIYFEGDDEDSLFFPLEIPNDYNIGHKPTTSIVTTDSLPQSSIATLEQRESDSDDSLIKGIHDLHLPTQATLKAQSETIHSYTEPSEASDIGPSIQDNCNESDFSDDASLLNELFGLEI
jgi:hypothetical protein